jgi:hypothetical protein
MGIVHGDDDKFLAGSGVIPGINRLIGWVSPEPFPEHLNGREVGKSSAHRSFNIWPNDYFYNQKNIS